MIPLPSMLGADVGKVSIPPVYPIQYVGGSSNTSSSTTTVVLTQPAGVTTNDFGIISTRNPSQASNVPSGWTQLATNIFYKKYGASEGSVTVANFGPSDNVATLHVYRGVHTTAPIDASSTRASTSGTSIPSNATPLSALHDGSMLVSTIRGSCASPPTVTPPNLMLLGADSAPAVLNGGFASIAYQFAPLNTGASSGARSWTTSPAINGSSTVGLILLRAAGT